MFEDESSAEFDDDQFDDATIPCPLCGEEIYDDVHQCPKCGEYIVESDRRAWSNKPRWLVRLGFILILLAAIGFIAPILFPLIELLSGP